MKIKQVLHYFSLFEWSLWLTSVTLVLISYFIGNESYPLTLIASLLGATALIFIAKGNVLGQFLTIIFSILYGIISLKFRYYGEMITYVFMSLPSATIACITWLKNPSTKGKNEVKIATMPKGKWYFLTLSAIVVTVLFYFLLKYFQTENLLLSTLSVSTSYFASMLLIFRSPYYAVAYSANDIVLIGLWVYASFSSISYLPMVICFVAFLANDLYGFINWKKMQKSQQSRK